MWTKRAIRVYRCEVPRVRGEVGGQRCRFRCRSAPAPTEVTEPQRNTSIRSRIGIRAWIVPSLEYSFISNAAMGMKEVLRTTYGFVSISLCFPGTHSYSAVTCPTWTVCIPISPPAHRESHKACCNPSLFGIAVRVADGPCTIGIGIPVCGYH